MLAAPHPDRVVAVWLRSGSAAMFRARPEFPQPTIPTGAYTIPTMCNPGAKEDGPYKGTLSTFQEYRLKDAPIGFEPDQRTGHECGDSRCLAIPFFDACLAMRLPDEGSKAQALKPVDMSQAWLAASATPLRRPLPFAYRRRPRATASRMSPGTLWPISRAASASSSSCGTGRNWPGRRKSRCKPGLRGTSGSIYVKAVRNGTQYLLLKRGIGDFTVSAAQA